MFPSIISGRAEDPLYFSHQRWALHSGGFAGAGRLRFHDEQSLRIRKTGCVSNSLFLSLPYLFFHVLSLEIPSLLPEKTQMFRLFSKKWESRGVVQRFPLKFKIPDTFLSLLFLFSLKQSFPQPRRSREPRRRLKVVVSHSSRLPGDMLPVSFLSVLQHACVFKQRKPMSTNYSEPPIEFAEAFVRCQSGMHCASCRLGEQGPLFPWLAAHWETRKREERASLSLSYFLSVCIVLIRVPLSTTTTLLLLLLPNSLFKSPPFYPSSFPFNLFSPPLLLVSPSGYEIVNDNVKIHLYFCLLSRKIREKVGSQRTDALFSIHGSIFVRKPFDCVPTHLIWHVELSFSLLSILLADGK